MHWMTAAKVKATAAEAAATAALGTTLRIGRFVAPFATPRTWFYATNYETAGELPPRGVIEGSKVMSERTAYQGRDQLDLKMCGV